MAMGCVAIGSLCVAAKDRNNIFDGHDEEPIVALEVHRYGVLGIKKHAVILIDWPIRVIVNLHACCYDPTGDGGDFHGIRQVDAHLGDLAISVLSDQDPVAHRLDYLEPLRFGDVVRHERILAGHWGVHGLLG